MIYAIADTHFNHKKVLTSCNRPFESIEKHDETLITCINNTVGVGDILYINGDMCFHRDPTHYLDLIKCQQVHLVMGGHDYRYHSKYKKLQMDGRIHLHDLVIIRWEKRMIFMCHYPVLSWPQRRYGVPHAFGHMHGRIRHPVPGSVDIGVDVIGHNPISFNDIYDMVGIWRPDDEVEV